MIGTVIYNRARRKWEVWRNGFVLHSFPPGKEGHLAALETWIGLNDMPTLRLQQRAAKRYPELRERLIRAAAIWLDCGITIVGEGYEVLSQNGNGRYHVGLNGNGDWECECQDFEHGLVTNNSGAPWQGSGPKCKHILAVMLMLKWELIRETGQEIFEEVV